MGFIMKIYNSIVIDGTEFGSFYHDNWPNFKIDNLGYFLEPKDDKDELDFDLIKRRYDIEMQQIQCSKHYTIRNTTFPIHEVGPKIIDSYDKLDISFPTDEYNDATYRILQAFDLCLIEMREWFVS